MYDVKDYSEKLGEFCTSGSGSLKFPDPAKGNEGIMIPTSFSKKGGRLIPAAYKRCDSSTGDSETFVLAMNNLYNERKAINFQNFKAIMMSCGISSTIITVAMACDLDKYGLAGTQLYARLYCSTQDEGVPEVRWFSLSDKFLPETLRMIDFFSCAENALKVNDDLLNKELMEASAECVSFWTDRAGLAMTGPDADAQVMEQRKKLKKTTKVLPGNLVLNVIEDEYGVLG